VLLAMLALVGAAVGVIGTLVGAGGGFLVVPILVLGLSVQPSLAAGTSLVVVTANAVVGTAAHGLRGRVDWPAGLFLAVASYPGSLLGAWLGPRIRADLLTLGFGVLLILLALWMAYRIFQESRQEAATAEPRRPAPHGPIRMIRRLPLPRGKSYTFTFDIPIAVAGSLVIGLLGGLLGIGGGPLLVPFLIFGLNYPAHVAAATSQLNIALTSFGAALVYLLQGSLIPSYAVALSAGVIVGSPLGAWLATRIKARILVWMMAGILLFLGLRLAL